MFKHLKYCKVLIWLVLLGCVGFSSGLVLRITIARYQSPFPQAILVLEGQTARIRFAANFSQSHPTLPIWISGNPEGYELNQSIFRQAGIPASLVHYDFCATDTVTNFTCNVSALKANHIQHVYVITSDYHMLRAEAIATLVFGSHGIVITPVEVAAPGWSAESFLKIPRDCLRALLWLLTGKSGASLQDVF